MIIIGKAVRSQRLLLPLLKKFSQIPKFNADKDYYSILEVNPDAPELDIKRAYYRLAKAYHPDNNPDQKNRFQEISQAYSVLSDPSIRQLYTQARRMKAPQNPCFTGDPFRKQPNFGEQRYEEQPNSLDLTEEELKVFQQTKRFIKWMIIIGLGLAMFYPFFSWQSGATASNGNCEVVQTQSGQRLYPRRRGGFIETPPQMNQPQTIQTQQMIGRFVE